jgi:glucose/arabinose dehydrogenase
MKHLLLSAVLCLVSGVGAGEPAPPGDRPHRLPEDWRLDVPGRPHRIEPERLAPPFATAAAANPPRLVPRPPAAALAAPPGFRVTEFTRKVQGPRVLKLAPNGDVFVTETFAGRIKLLRPSADGRRAAAVQVYAEGLTGPSGMAFYPPGPDPHWLYVAETNRIVRYPYRVGALRADADPEVIVPQLYPGSPGGHSARDLAFTPDGRRLFVSVGSRSNLADGMPAKTAAEVVAWEAMHGRGAAWGDETNRADVLVFDNGDPGGKVYATGLRNCVGLTIQPGSGDLWCTVNERDLLGDDLVPDYSTRVAEGSFYGWPWYYLGDHEDPRLRGLRPDLQHAVSVPDVPYQAHSAALNLVFYTATTGRALFPPQYRGDGFVTMHGSWNRSVRTGHKVVRLRMRNGLPTGEYDDFLVGFIADNGSAWGRPAGIVVDADGALLVGDDAGNVVYRIAYRR